MCEFQEYGGECRGSGSSLLIFIELAPSKNDNCEEVKGLLSVFQKHGGECTGLLLILNVAEIHPIEADKLLRHLVNREAREDGSRTEALEPRDDAQATEPNQSLVRWKRYYPLWIGEWHGS